jgi:hypothetical protein
MNISVVVPTIRNIEIFKSKWESLLKRHNCSLIIVKDGNHPEATINNQTFSVKNIMGKYSNLIYNHNDGIRNLGFILAKKSGANIILSLDDDVEPWGDTINDHLYPLSQSFPVSWMNTSMTEYMRGFPYEIRHEAECWVSHGVWEAFPIMMLLLRFVLELRNKIIIRGLFPRTFYFPAV